MLTTLLLGLALQASTPDIAVYQYGENMALRDALIRQGDMFDDLGGQIVGEADAVLAETLGVTMADIAEPEANEVLYTFMAHSDPGADKIEKSGRALWHSPSGHAALVAMPKAAIGKLPMFRCHGAIRPVRLQPIKPTNFQGSNRLTAIVPNAAIQGMVSQVSQTNLQTDVATMEAFGTRRHNEPGEVSAENWLVARMQSLGLQTSTFDYDSGADVVIGEITGLTDPSKIVVIGAHYDSVNWQGSAGSPAPGADDDASGTAGILEIARILVAQGGFDYTIRFCAWSGEEFGLLGSDAYATMLANTGANVIGMVQLDMTAYRAPGDTRSVDFVTNDTDAGLNAFAMDVYAAYVPGLAINSGFLAAGTSDHRSFFNNGFPATFPFEDVDQYSPYIHTPNDTSGTSANDFVLSQMITQGALATIAELARPLSMTMAHNALPDTQDEIGPYTATVDVVSQTAATVSTVDLFWRLEGQPTFNTVSMSPTGTPDQWGGDIPGQISPERVEYYIVANDSAGGTAYTPDGLQAGDNLNRFVIGVYNQIAFYDFEAGTDEGWTHVQVAQQDDWQRGTPAGKVEDPGSAYAGSNAWGNDLGPSGFNGSYATNVENYLESPALDCSGQTDVKLRFARWLTVEEAQYDQAQIHVNGQLVWENPFSGNLIDTSWSLQDLDISTWADNNPSVVVRFTLKSDGGVEFGGWNIDNFELYTLEPVGGGGSMSLSGTTSVNAGSQATLSVTNAAATSTWYLLYSFSNSGTTIFGTPFDIGTPWFLAFTGMTDANGDGSHSFTVPPAGAGSTVYFEAATNVGGIVNSNLHTMTVN